jgi:hypothetical protein
MSHAKLTAPEKVVPEASLSAFFLFPLTRYSTPCYYLGRPPLLKTGGFTLPKGEIFMSVVGKFRVNQNVNGHLNMHPVYSGSPENKTFWANTPNGNISMYMTNPDAIAFFESNEEYYVTFTKATKATE